jgi:hypothetical protein
MAPFVIRWVDCRRVTPDAFQIILDGVHPLCLQVIDPAGALRLLCHQAGLLQQAQAAGYRNTLVTV